MKTLGAQLVAVGPGTCEIELPFSSSLGQQHGFLHAGATTSIADSAAGYAAYTLTPKGSSVLTTELKINLLSPAQGERFFARAEVLKAGKTLTVVTSKVFAVQKGQEKLCAFLTASIMTVPHAETI
ncbi:PaaI family thioesterase [Bdellovibrio bacteriovorus]